MHQVTPLGRRDWLQRMAGTGLALLIPDARAQSWPQRPITIVVPYGAGGNTDLIARLTATQLGQSLGQPVLVDNRPGASGLIAARFVAAARPDGYTLFMGTLSQLVTAPLLQAGPAMDLAREFAPVVNIGANAFVLTVNAQLPVKTLADLVAYAKQRPGKLTYGSGGVGGLTHLSSYLFARRSGIELLHVPYKGASAAMTDLLGGQIDLYSASPSEVLPQLASGKLRALAVSGLRRLKELPQVPTIAESYPGYEVASWNGLLAPAATPVEVLDRVAAEVSRMQKDAAVQKKLEDAGITPMYVSRAAFAAQIQREAALWGPVLNGSGIRLE